MQATALLARTGVSRYRCLNSSDPFGLCPECRMGWGAPTAENAEKEARYHESLTNRDRAGIAVMGAGAVLGGAAIMAGTAGLSAAAALAAPASRISSGDFERAFHTTAGTIRVFGEAVTNGRTLTLNNFMVYPDNARRLQPGIAEIRAGFRAVTDAARESGFDRLIVNFHRTSGASVGKTSQRIIEISP